MKKSITAAIAILSLSVLLFPLKSFSYDWPKSLTISAPAQGPKYFSPLALAGVLEAKTGMKVRVTPESAPAQRMRALKDGAIEMTVDGSDAAIFITEAKGEFAQGQLGPIKLRFLWVAAIEAFAPMLRGDTKFKNIMDLKPGIKFAVPPGANPRQNCYGVAAWAGLKDDQWQMVEFGSMEAAVKSIPDGKADIVWWITDAGLTHEVSTTPKGLSWLAMDPASNPKGAERALAQCPNWTFGKAPESSVQSARGLPVVLVPTIISVKEDFNNELAYNIVKFIQENYEEIVAKHPSTASMKLSNVREILDTNFIPLHGGTIKYLKEKNLWSQADEKRQSYNISLWDKYLIAFNKALSDAKDKKIKTDPRDEEWIKLWEAHKKDLPRIRVMMEIP